MPRNQITVAEMRTRVEKIKNELYWEENKYGEEARGLAHKYVNMVFCLLYTSPSPRDVEESRMPSSA